MVSPLKMVEPSMVGVDIGVERGRGFTLLPKEMLKGR
jgi:hypothetical protein